MACNRLKNYATANTKPPKNSSRSPSLKINPRPHTPSSLLPSTQRSNRRTERLPLNPVKTTRDSYPCVVVFHHHDKIYPSHRDKYCISSDGSEWNYITTYAAMKNTYMARNNQNEEKNFFRVFCRQVGGLWHGMAWYGMGYAYAYERARHSRTHAT